MHLSDTGSTLAILHMDFFIFLAGEIKGLYSKRVKMSSPASGGFLFYEKNRQLGVFKRYHFF